MLLTIASSDFAGIGVVIAEILLSVLFWLVKQKRVAIGLALCSNNGAKVQNKRQI